MRKFWLLLLVLALAPLQAKAADVVLGTIASSGASVNNSTTASTFSIPHGVPLLVQCSANSYVIAGSGGSTQTVSSSTGLVAPANQTFSLGPPDYAVNAVAIQPVSGSATCTVLYPSGQTGGFVNGFDLLGSDLYPNSVTATSYLSSAAITATASIQTPVINGPSGTARISIPSAGTTTITSTQATTGTGAVGVKLVSSGISNGNDAALEVDNSAGFAVGVMGDGSISLRGGTAKIGATAFRTLTIAGAINDSANAKGVVLNNAVSLTTSGAEIVSVQNNGTEKAAIDKDGKLSTYGGKTTAGMGVSPIYAYGTVAGASVDSVAFVSFMPSAQGLFEVGGYLNVTSLTSGSAGLRVTYTDCGGVVRNIVMAGEDASNTTKTVITATGSLDIFSQTICANAATISFSPYITGTLAVSEWAYVRQVN